ncbi:hypothetical protein ACIQOF_01760 [Streptomyces sp. NPDC091265]|uniref:hypothetical protein n=1 Tax=unclassified Streptomyces TaxID=2593676 RepID=UPI00344B7A01
MPDSQASAPITPEAAYATAPDITREITWVSYTARDFTQLTDPREYWLRKAAVFDRIALAERQRTFIVAGSSETDAAAALLADVNARRLIDHDRATTTDAPRDYVRNAYARWINEQ